MCGSNVTAGDVANAAQSAAQLALKNADEYSFSATVKSKMWVLPLIVCMALVLGVAFVKALQHFARPMTYFVCVFKVVRHRPRPLRA